MYYVYKFIFIVVSAFVAMIINPTFIAKCATSENDILCIIIKIGIFFLTYIVLVKLFGSKKK